MTPNLLLEEKFMNADALIKEGKITEAVEALNNILKDEPDYGKAHNHLGWIYETKIVNYDLAENHYRLAVKFAPEYTPTYYNYAILLSTLKKYNELNALLEQAMNVKGINKGTLYNEYGIMYEAQGKYDEAIEAYKNYVKNIYDNKNMDTAVDSINRCKRKKEILSM